MFPWVSGSWDDRIDFLRMRENFDRRGGWMMMMEILIKRRRRVGNASRIFLNRLVWVRGIVWGKCELFAKKQKEKEKKVLTVVMLTRYLSNSLALAEARLILAKLIWNFDFELDGDHESWVDDARFYVSSISTYTAVSHV